MTGIINCYFIGLQAQKIRFLIYVSYFIFIYILFQVLKTFFSVCHKCRLLSRVRKFRIDSPYRGNE